MLPENMDVTRADIQEFFKTPAGKSRQPSALKAFLIARGLSEEEATRILADVNSYT